ncbi:MAG: diguanylate cyclase [Peptostreptococcaceae bacterium]|nr:diguanylate cyclase [Peptostreptococcaceae bacterium]
MWNIRKTGLLAVFVFIFVMMLFVSLILIRGNTDHPGYTEEFEGGFALSVNGVPQPDFKRERPPNFTVNPKDVVEITVRLPQTKMYEPVAVCTLSYIAVEAFVDGEPIYSYGIRGGKTDEKIGAGYHKMRLPEEFAGKNLYLRLTGIERHKFSYLFRGLFLSENHDIAVPIIRQNLFAFSTSVTLILFGILLLAIFLILCLARIQLKGLAPLAMFSFSVGLWTLCNIEFVRIFSEDLLVNNYIRYFSCYFALLPWVVMVADLKRHSRHAWSFGRFAYGHVIFLSVVILAELFGIADYKRFMLFYNILVAAAAIAGLYVMGSGLQEQKGYEKILFWGNLVPLVYVFAQILFFNLAKYFSFSVHMDYASLYISLLMVIVVFFSVYGMRFSDRIVSRKEVEFLRKMAYEDPLTGLENRQGGLLRLLELDRGKEDYHLIVLDLNCLKRVNDEYGHDCGDRMIVLFAGCLRSAFAERSMVCRWGGDEFLVILHTGEEEEVRKGLHRLGDCIGEANRREANDSVCLETAYGVSSTREGHGFDHEKIIKAADEKMYLHKKQMKNEGDTGSSCHVEI